MTAPERPRVGTQLPTHLEVSAASDTPGGRFIRITAVRVVEGWQIVEELDGDISRTRLFDQPVQASAAAAYCADMISVAIRERNL